MRSVMLGGLLSTGACSLVGSGLRSTETTAAKYLIPPEQENSLGLQVKNELEQKEHIKYLNDPQVQAYVRQVADKVIALGKKERPEVTWQVNVIDDPKTVNAFATPGGYLYVYSGLLTAADNEAELAGVMAHETGHVIARHSGRQMVAAYGLEAVTSMALGKNPGMVAQAASAIAGKGALLAHSRADETEADEYGVKYTSMAGYDPHGLVSFFGKLKALEGKTPHVLSFLSDHPATQDRIDHINQMIGQKRLGGSDLGAARYAAIKQRVASAPAAAPQPAPSNSPHRPPPS